jgi:hypothetical protein
MNINNIIVDKKELGKLLGAAKRTWTATKKRVIKTDEISRAENAIFANDVELAQMVKAKQIIDAQITEHIDTALENNRGYNQAELEEKKQEALLLLLKEALHEFDSTHGTLVHEGKPDAYILDFKDVRIRLGNMIKEMEGAD